MPSQAELQRRFSYSIITGALTNKLTGITYKKNKYAQLWVNGIKYGQHRIIYKLVTGLEPEGVIDHINNDPTDNSWINLQDITPYENSLKDRNLPVYPPKYHGRHTRWIVRPELGDNKKGHLSFSNKADAYAAAAFLRSEHLRNA